MNKLSIMGLCLLSLVTQSCFADITSEDLGVHNHSPTKLIAHFHGTYCSDWSENDVDVAPSGESGDEQKSEFEYDNGQTVRCYVDVCKASDGSCSSSNAICKGELKICTSYPFCYMHGKFTITDSSGADCTEDSHFSFSKIQGIVEVNNVFNS